MASLISDSSEEQREVLFQVLGYCLEGLRADLPWEWRCALYGDLVSFVEESWMNEELPEEYLGMITQIKVYLMSEYQKMNQSVN